MNQPLAFSNLLTQIKAHKEYSCEGLLRITQISKTLSDSYFLALKVINRRNPFRITYFITLFMECNWFLSKGSKKTSFLERFYLTRETITNWLCLIVKRKQKKNNAISVMMKTSRLEMQ